MNRNNRHYEEQSALAGNGKDSVRRLDMDSRFRGNDKNLASEAGW